MVYRQGSKYPTQFWFAMRFDLSRSASEPFLFNHAMRFLAIRLYCFQGKR